MAYTKTIIMDYNLPLSNNQNSNLVYKSPESALTRLQFLSGPRITESTNSE